MKTVLFAFSLLLCAACAGVPDNIRPVIDFDVERYMGTWYEIARLDHRFERGLQNVTATYSLNNNGTVRVLNKGFATEKNKWKDAVGKARFAGERNVGALEVSFFGPFYGPYVIFELDSSDYQYAFVASSENYLWFLSRTPTVGDELKEKFLQSANAAGFQTDGLIFVNHEPR